MGDTLGLDIGIGSVGSFLLSDDNKIKYMGVRIFNPAKEASSARKARSQRRNLKRKKWRKEQLKELFNDFSVISKTEMSQDGYFCFETNNKVIERPKDKTVYHLRKRALSEKVTKRELILCLYNVLHARGNFLMETIDFSKDNITVNDYIDYFFETTDEYLKLGSEAKKEVTAILNKIFDTKYTCNDIKKMVKELKASIDPEEQKKLEEILKLITGYQANIKSIDEDLLYSSEKAKIIELKSSEELVDDFLISAIELYDLMNINQVLKGHEYLCEVSVSKLDEYENAVKAGVDSEEYQKIIEKIKDSSKKSNSKSKKEIKHNRVLRNLENNFPNGLYVKETNAILNKQAEYYKEITPEFIEICNSIIRARIPYYIGPLDSKGKNAWIEKKNKFKYSYEYSKEKLDSVNETESIVKWINRMRSHCTYLPEEFALPKGSFLSETFNILNELNILKAIDSNGDDYWLKYEDKIKIFDDLFLKKTNVEYDDVCKLLNLSYFGTKAKGSQKEFNNHYTLYLQLTNILPKLKLNSIKDLKKEKEKVEKLEEYILRINLYSEEKTKIEYFCKECIEENVAKKLAKLKSKSFCSYSKKFICDTPMNKDGESLIDLLFDDNNAEYTNEQMTLISKATDKDGKHVDYISNKYERIIEKNDGKLDYNLLFDENKPLMPISRPVLRSLNECLKVYNEIINVYGCPSRTVIETARDFKDFYEVKQKKSKHFKEVMSLYDYIIRQFKEDKEGKKYNPNTNKLENKNDIESYYKKNKEKIELYIRQMGADLLTGDPIILEELDKYEVDHILPRGFGDDSMDNKELVLKTINGKKDNRLPLEFIDCGDCKNKQGNLVTTSDFINRVKILFDMKLISEKKYKMLMLQDRDDLDGFINQNLVDTRYVIREFMSILRAYNKYNNNKNKVVALKSSFTSTYRKAFNIDKVRDFGDQHHAIDAAMLVVADKTLSTYYPYYGEMRNYRKGENLFSSYDKVIQTIASKDNESNEKDELNKFIRYTYGEAFKSNPKLVEQIKSYIPFYSLKVEKNWMGKFYDATIVTPYDKEHKVVLSNKDIFTVLNINNQTRKYKTAEVAAIDVYKFTNSKGKKENAAIFIPKIIIDKNGLIDKEKYKKIVNEYYKKPELIDETGEIKNYYFKMRLFVNDIAYNDSVNKIVIIKGGSVAHKTFEMGFVDIHSYNSIYNLGLQIRKDLIKNFNIKTKINIRGIDFSKLSRESMVEQVANLYWGKHEEVKKIKFACKEVEKKKIKNVYELSNYLAYLTLIIDVPCQDSEIGGRYQPSLNSLANGKDDSRLIKLKYNILGIRFTTNNDGKLIIESPKALSGGFKKITKEDFNWKISKYSL